MNKPFSLQTALQAVIPEHHLDIEERAAIYQFEAGLPQEEAERQSFRDYTKGKAIALVKISGRKNCVPMVIDLDAKEDPRPGAYWKDEIERDAPADHVPYKTRGLPDGDKMHAKRRKP